MFQRDEKNVANIQDFPCLTLNVTVRVIPLPGVLYMLTFEKEVAQNILGHFKNSKDYRNHPLLTEIEKDNAIQKPNVEVITPLTQFQKTYDSLNNDKSLYLTLVPSENGDPCVGCVAKIAGVFSKGKIVLISFKTLKRAIVDVPLLNSGNNIYESPIEVIDDSSKILTLKGDDLKSGYQNFVSLFDSLDKTITSFKAQYKQSFDNKKISQHLLLLSPLCNSLFFQLNESNFNRAWSLITGLVLSLRKDIEKKKDFQIYLEVLKLIDLVIAVLPTLTKQKRSILLAIGLTERFKEFNAILQDHQKIFDVLYTSTDYVKEYFTHASNLTKSRLISNQLKSLKLFIDDLKFQNTFTAKVGNPENKYNALTPRYPKATKDSATMKGEGGNEEEEEDNDMKLLKNFIDELSHLDVHPDGIKMLRKDYKRLAKMSPQNTDYQVLKNYFDIVIDLPFGKYSEGKPIDLDWSRKTFNEDHYGLQMVKKRLLEYLCILKLQGTLGDRKNKAPIILLVGPPGVGKTSIAKSVAKVLNRKFQRISLGGIHNEAEIRGHRRTYVGSMCGLIVNALRKSGCMDPLILLDEVDKVLSTTGGSSGYSTKINGDPGAALLEVLDPEQNNTFMDHYIGFPVDLSQIIFFCTANDLSGISTPLLDRMEIIEIPGYTPEEKIQIGTNFLLPKQISLHGLDKCECEFQISDNAWGSLVLEYTREPGVRSLERQLAAIVRGKVREVVENEDDKEKNHFNSRSKLLRPRDLLRYLGFPLHPVTKELLQEVKFTEREGIVNGLSYNSDGTGSVLVFEIVKISNEDDVHDARRNSNGPTIISTGNLGNVLQESINIGKSVVKTILRKKHIIFSPQMTLSFREFLSSEYHLHVPAGAVSKDGPSAGVAITMALLSVALKKPVDPAVCMTGEITLRGKILPIGGVREKLLGARIFGMRKVLVPLSNRSDLVEAITDDIVSFADQKDRPELTAIRKKMNLEIHYVDTIYDVIKQIWPDICSNDWVLQKEDVRKAKF